MTDCVAIGFAITNNQAAGRAGWKTIVVHTVMSSEREIRKRAQGRDRTARWRATKQSERATALALAEFRSTLLLNLLKVLHTQVDAADEAGDEDTWFTRLLESKRAGLHRSNRQ